MRINTQDLTLQRNYLEKYQYLISEYELVKQKKHSVFAHAKDFYTFHHTCAQSFLKYYNRYLQSDREIVSLLPQKRGPRYKSRRIDLEIEKSIGEWRDKGVNRYEMVSILRPLYGSLTPSPSGIYNVYKRLGKNKLNTPMKEEKRKIIKDKLGEMGHIDCHYLSQSIIRQQHHKLYLVCVIDDKSRVAWAELVEDIKSLTVMFATMRCFNTIKSLFRIYFEEVLTDNGPEFGSRQSKSKEEHPFERLLLELGIKHRYTRPYRPQTNGKVERFWRTLEDDLLRGADYDSITELKEELLQYLYYYNKLRPHQGISGQTPESLTITNPSTN